MGHQADCTTTPTTDSAPPGNADRDAQGRFTKGNRGGPGNPFARRVAAIRQVFYDAVSDEELRCICQRFVAQAMLGDVPSGKLVLSYLLGKVPEPVNPDTLDQEECRQYLQNPSTGDVQEVSERRPAAVVSLALMRGTHIAQEEQARRVFCQEPGESQAPKGEPQASAGEPGASAPGGPAPLQEGTPSGASRSRLEGKLPSANGGVAGAEQREAPVVPARACRGFADSAPAIRPRLANDVPSANGRNGPALVKERHLAPSRNGGKRKKRRRR